MNTNIQQLRPEVLAFALLMEQRLREKDEDKSDQWKTVDEGDLLVQVNSKTMLLDASVRGGYDAKVRHAVDLANYCMMVADVAGALESAGGE